MRATTETSPEPIPHRRRARLRVLAALLLAWLPVSPTVAAETRSNFDHLTTGFELLGQHRDLPCEACHANAVFKGTPTACGACHGIGTAVRATAKPHNHILSTDQCQSCHTPWGFNPAVDFDHTQVLGSCSTCHNGALAQGKPPTHIVTDLECDACHDTLSWGGAVFAHVGVTSGCAACHNGVSADGLSASHFPISAAGVAPVPCEACHSTSEFSTFADATISHPAVQGLSCTSCHETAAFIGMHPSTNTTAGDSRPNATLDPKHPTTGDCGQCHTTVSFAASVSRPANHIPTTAPCAQCHTTGNDAQYSVTGTHQGVTSCLSCHGPGVGPFANITIVGAPASHIPIGTLDCNGSGCHSTANVNPGGFLIGAPSLTSPTLSVAGHTTAAAAVAACQTCHETAPYLGMIASTAGAWGDSRPSAFDALHPTTGDCGGCHTTAPTFGTDITAGKPANHIPTSAPCAQCHTTGGNYAAYSVPATHQGLTGCLACHAPAVATTFTNVTIVTTPASHIPIGTLDCNGSGCHSTANVSAGGFKLGTASITSPTLNVAGHTTIAAVAACATCHETAPYLGMLPSSATAGADSRPTAFDAKHPTTGDCGNCHVTTPTFASNLLPTAPKPANHIPTTAVCAQCHTTSGNFAVYSVSGVHQGVTGCIACHGPSVATTFVNVTIVTTPATHMPIGSLDCNGSGCHTTANVNPGGFLIGAASISSPTLTVAGHTRVATAVSGCQTCHETAPYIGMVASTASAAGDSRPTALDKAHPTTGDCSGCHTTTPTFASDQTGKAKPANHIPTSATCTQCHTTAGNYAAYSRTGTHQGVTGCIACHGSSVAATFANVTIVTTPATHMPVGSLDCNGSGCHTTANVNPGGFLIGAANVSSPTLTVAGHTTVAAAVTGCQTCHETAPYIGMVASTATTAGDSRPTAFDKNHPTTGDCGGCHTTTPTFTSNVTSGSKPSNHIPTSAACTQCHTTAGNYAAYVMGATGHSGISNNCAQCHAYGLSFYNMAPPTLVEPPSGSTGHIPAVPPNGTTVIACELCHSPSAFTTFSGTGMKHAEVVAMKCDSCHEYGMAWKTNAGVQLWTRPSPNHHAGQDCNGSGCHTARDKLMFRPRVQTPATATNTATTTANPPPTTPAATHPTVPPGHLATTGNCQSCHSSLAWLPVLRVDHSQVLGTCVSCHNGTLAAGKSAHHFATSGACERCHTTNGWTPARFDHTGVVAHGCSGCHNGVQAIGMARSHIPTAQACDACHGTLAWEPALVDHSAFSGSCAGCHNASAAVGLPPGHLRTRLDCASCHRFPQWGAVTFRHASLAYPGDHANTPGCLACHTTGTDAVTYAAPAYAGSCAGCHAAAFNAAAHPKTLKGQLYSVRELANCSGACHVYADPGLTAIARKLPGPHHRVMDAAFRR
jgi:hypothetical protein